MAKAKATMRGPPPAARSSPQSHPTSNDYHHQQQQARSVAESHQQDSPAMMEAAKKKKKKGKAKRIDDDEEDDDEEAYDGTTPLSPPSSHPNSYAHGPSPAHLSHAANAQAQAQADLLATASDLYRRIEADPQGIPDDDAYWTSLPAHLRTFIRNALPLGQFPTTGAGHPNDPNARHASTQAMIAVAQQLAQAAHASQRHLQQYPPGSQPYPSLPFDPAIFADLALHTDPGAALHQHPHANGISNVASQGPYAHVHYSTGVNPPPTQPPGEPLPAPVVLVNEYGEEAGEYDDDYYSDDDLDGPNGTLHDHHGLHGPAGNGHGGLGARDGSWPAQDQMQRQAQLAAAYETAPSGKKNKKKKKKKSGSAANDAANSLPPSVTNPPVPTKQQSAPPTAANNISSAMLPPPRGSQPPPSSRAAGKQPMTFNANTPAKSNAANGHVHHNAGSKRSAAAPAGSVSSHGTGAQAPSQQPPRIWSTSTAEERERIKEFWLRLNEKERRSLLQIEKDAVLRKMKEQQKHSCSCAVCGRKRSAIESELEVLYNAYYEELEQYVDHQQQHVKSGGAIAPPPGPGPFPGSVTLDSAGNVIGGNALTKPAPQNQRTRVTAPPKKAVPPTEDDDGYDDELDDDEYDDEYDDEEDEEDDDVLPEVNPTSRKRAAAAPNANDAFPLGSSLTVKGGILTVADDLLKNDGQKFLEMMEQLADRRMQREEDAAAELNAMSDASGEEDEDIDDDLDDEDAEDEDDTLTDEQRMEEGRRMFQIFAARLFEQRVLSAYREQIAQERQLQLLRELEEEDLAEKEKEAKRQKENQKKKDKKRQQQLKKEEERLKRESEKAAEEAAAREKAEKARQLELKRQEESRQKREAEKKAKEEERLRKEEEKRKRLEAEKAKEAERERQRKEREEKARAEKEAREAERKAREEELRREKEQKDKEEREKKAVEEKARAEAAAAVKQKEQAEREAGQARTKQTNERHSAPSKGGSSGQSPPSPTTMRSSNSVPKSPAANVRARQTSIPPSPSAAAPVMYARPPPSGSSTIPHRPPTGPSQNHPRGATPTGPSQGSSLPAPPQGLPARPSSKVAPFPPTTAASSSVATGPPHQVQGSAQASTASASRPSTASNLNLPTSGQTQTPSQQPSFLAFNAAVSPSGNVSVNKSAPPGFGAPSSPAVSTNHANAAQPLATSPQPAVAVSRSGGLPASATNTFSIPAGFPSSVETARSPTMSNGLRSGSHSAGLSSKTPGFDSLHSPSAVNNAAHALSSLSIGGPGAFGSASGLNHLPHQQQTPASVSSGPGPIGLPANGSPHGRLPSTEEHNSLHSSPSQGNRTIHRPGPIGRPKPTGELSDDAVFGRSGSPKLPEGILGSSALGGDDELIAPQPRRTSSTVAPIGGGSSLFGFGSASGVGSTAGSGTSSAFSNSPWGSSSFTSPPPTNASVASPAFASLGPSLGGGSAGNANGVGSIGSAIGGASAPLGGTVGSSDPWAPRSQSGWDRARYAFEQPAGNGVSAGGFGPQLPQQQPMHSGLGHQQHHQFVHQTQPQPQQQHGVTSGNVFGQHTPLSPYAAQHAGGARSIFDSHPGSTGSPLQRHATDHRGF